MRSLSLNALCSIRAEMNWQHNEIPHKEIYFSRNVNPRGDFLPAETKQELLENAAGKKHIFYLHPGQGELPEYDPNRLKRFKKTQFDGRMPDNATLTPRYGRFYPKGRLLGPFNAFDTVPFRVLDVDASTFVADLNHPMAEKPVELALEVVDVTDNIDSMRPADWFKEMIDGPGIQSRANNRPTEFITEDALSRKDESPDSAFYNQPRLVIHLDTTAVNTVSEIYGRLVPHGADIIDLMSSWKSHLPKDRSYKRITGLGLNQEELAKNDRLTDYVVHDLNEHPVLPFEHRRYDAVICTVSVEYITHPFKVFQQVARILRPGGVFAVTFSNRWFPPKVITIWREIHEFERMGLVAEYFLNSGAYEHIGTISVRGLKRPSDDKYADAFEFSDPVYCVYGYAS
ncbi:MAG: methyltransferase domain-containing protein [Desulfobacterales bacterium]